MGLPAPAPPRAHEPPHRGGAGAGDVVADTTRAHRVLETSQPPAYYLDPADVDLTLLRPEHPRHVLRVEGAGVVLRRRGRRRRGRGGGVDLPPTPSRPSSRSVTTSRSTPSSSTAPSTARRWSATRARSTAAGSRATSSDRSRAAPAPPTGSRAHPSPLGVRGRRVPLLVRRPRAARPGRPSRWTRCCARATPTPSQARCCCRSPTTSRWRAGMDVAGPCLERAGGQGADRRAPRRAPHHVPDVERGGARSWLKPPLRRPARSSVTHR